MKRQTYRKVRQACRKAGKDRQDSQDTLYSQETAEFDYDEFRKNVEASRTRRQTDWNKEDTAEIRLEELEEEEVKENRWRWSGRSHWHERLIAIVLVILALIVAILVFPRLIVFVRKLFSVGLQSF